MKNYVFPKTNYYAKDNSGNIRFWAIEGYVYKDENDVLRGKLEMEHGVLGGESICNFENVPYGLANRSIQEQVYSRVDSRINKKMQSGYTPNIEDAKENTRTNKLGLKRCMLACKFSGIKNKLDYRTAYMQRKYNGHRCMIHFNDIDGGATPYTRNGIVINSIKHITEKLKGKDLPTLDGELYHHGTKFQVVSSWIKKHQPETKKLVYIVYDIMLDLPYSERFEYLRNLDIWDETIILAETYKINCQEDAMELFRQFRRDEYEGGIIRVDSADKYEDGKRSKSLIKMKEFFDDEFLITDVLPSAEGWGRLCCVTKDGKQFVVSAPGNHDQKREILENKTKYIGQYVNVEFAEYTNDGRPFHGIATAIRNKPLE